MGAQYCSTVYKSILCSYKNATGTPGLLCLSVLRCKVYFDGFILVLIIIYVQNLLICALEQVIVVVWSSEVAECCGYSDQLGKSTQSVGDWLAAVVPWGAYKYWMYSFMYTEHQNQRSEMLGCTFCKKTALCDPSHPFNNFQVNTLFVVMSC